jgi:hypothetical protein
MFYLFLYTDIRIFIKIYGKIIENLKSKTQQY